MATDRLTWTWAALIIAGAMFACDTPDSPTDLDPEGPPMVRQVFLSSTSCPAPPLPMTATCRTDVNGSGYQSRGNTLAVGTHPDAVEDGLKMKVATGPTTADPNGYPAGAVALNNRLRVIMDELLIGNYIEEIQCRSIVDSDQFQTVPVGATPDDIADCSLAADVLTQTCVPCNGSNDGSCNEHAVCICEIPGGCNVGVSTVPPGQPVGVLDEDEDGTSDAHQFIGGSVGVRCDGVDGPVDVPMNVQRSYWQPSGNQQVPAVGGLGALGPAVVLVPEHGLPTGALCHVSFSDNVTDKGGNNVCAPKWGPDGAPDETAWPPAVECVPGDTTEASFGVEILRTTGGSPLPPPAPAPMNVNRNNPITINFNAELDPSSFEDAVFSPAVTFTVSQGMSKSAVILTPSAPLQAATTYTLTIPEPRDYFGQPMPEPLVITFTTGN
jgi:hypothetical protein